ncbi:hypothetical protein Drose_04440 [Dactylosporangium roseum]|uniref:Uncharacterized protein n=1 Tax=Dactylosporangium roseum TaxID=47989 RepID=A0ABY5Z645_9ACTN|nr:hypothetical protein [Dactylosporangium roseum]UWZ37538.1 hypothetical protein Drose_04440 [Dactylosporangium roseum]
MRAEDEIRADARPGRAFSNGTEFDIWADSHCYDCVHDNPNVDPEVFCPILTVALLGEVTPREWTERTITWELNGKTGTYAVVDECTEFEERRDDGPGDDEPKPDPGPPPVCEAQLDLIDAYLPTALDELTKAPAGVR